MTYTYDASGQRITKRGPQGETAYINQWFTLRNGEVGTKHVFAGTSRVVSKLVKQDKPNSKRKGKIVYEKDQYYYHPDHLGTTAYITHTNGQIYQHLEYFPFGETWVEEHSNKQRTPYLFTAKELDEETGLYYFGARYYDPRTSFWQSVDPIMGDYVGEDPNSLRNSGVFSSVNMAAFTYSFNKPTAVADPTGQYGVDSDGNIIFNKKSDTLDNAAEWAGYQDWKEAAAAMGVSERYDGKGNWKKGSSSLLGMKLPTKFKTNSAETTDPSVLKGFSGVDTDFTPDTLDSLVKSANSSSTDFSRIMNESVGGDLDFKLKMNSSMLYEHGGVLFNRNEAGNFVWSYFLESHGFGYFTQGALAQGGSLIQGRFDEPWDVRARHAGRDYYRSRFNVGNRCSGQMCRGQQ